jgi:outer membrane lipoprotein SlyB
VIVVRARHDAGQVVPLLAVVVALAAIGVLLLGRIGEAQTARARARTAADAVALAGAADGRDIAEDVARANDAAIVLWLDDGSSVEVAVAVDGQQAIARATRPAHEP